MPKSQTSAGQPFHTRTFSTLTEIKQHIAKIDERVEQVQELMQEGNPYVDAQKVKVEYGIKETIREIFGEQSSEFHAHCDHTIDLTGHTTIAKTTAMLKGLIAQLETHKAALLTKSKYPGKPAAGPPAGQRPTGAASAATPRPAAPPPPSRAA